MFLFYNLKKLFITKQKKCLQEVLNNKSSRVDYNSENTNNQMLILEKRYPLNTSLTKWVSIGIDPQELSPIVKIHNATLKGPKFTIQEWQEFLSLESILNIFYNDRVMFEAFKLKDYIIRPVIINNVAMIGVIYNNFELFLSAKSCFNLFVLKVFIHSYLKLLYSLDFECIFNDMVLKGLDLEYIETCLQHERIDHFAIREMIQFYPTIVNEKINRLFDTQIIMGMDKLCI